MLFSIIIPVYNVEQYLPECLESILNQTYKDFEVILVDDGSTDSSGTICDDFAKKYKKFKVIHKKNEGLLMARRTGLKYAKGNYIAHCDSDDYIDKNLLKQVYSAINKFDCDMVLFGYDVVDNDKNILETHCNIFENEKYFNGNKDDILWKFATTTWLNNMVIKITKRKCVDINNNYSEFKEIEMGEDRLQSISLIANCNSFVYISEPLYKYRYNPFGISKTIKIKYLDSYLIIAREVKSLCQAHASDKSILNCFYKRFELDVYKYLIEFLSQGINIKEYEILYNKIKCDSNYRKAIKKNKNLKLKFLKLLVKPQFFSIKKIICRLLTSLKK